jgi:hypothetical protein
MGGFFNVLTQKLAFRPSGLIPDVGLLFFEPSVLCIRNELFLLQ